VEHNKVEEREGEREREREREGIIGFTYPVDRCIAISIENTVASCFRNKFDSMQPFNVKDVIFFYGFFNVISIFSTLRTYIKTLSCIYLLTSIFYINQK